MLSARHHILLRPTGQRRPEFTQVIRIIAISFLNPAPGWMPRQVDANSAKEVSFHSSDLLPDHLADSLFQLHVPGSPARHRDRESCAVARHAPARSIYEAGARDSQAVHRAVDIRASIVTNCPHLGHTLPEGHIPVQQPQAFMFVQLVIKLLRLALWRFPRTHGLNSLVEGGHAGACLSIFGLFGVHHRNPPQMKNWKQVILSARSCGHETIRYIYVTDSYIKVKLLSSQAKT